MACSRPMLLKSWFSVAERSMSEGATSTFSVPVDSTMSSSESEASSSTLAMETSMSWALRPRPTVRLACGSMSTQRTLLPRSASAPARLMEVVVLPTPPFWLAIAMIRAKCALPVMPCDDYAAFRGKSTGWCANAPPCHRTLRLDLAHVRAHAWRHCMWLPAVRVCRSTGEGDQARPVRARAAARPARPGRAARRAAPWWLGRRYPQHGASRRAKHPRRYDAAATGEAPRSGGRGQRE